MSTLIVLFVCIQACLLQSVWSYCGARIAPLAPIAPIAPITPIAPAFGCGGATLGYNGAALGALAGGYGASLANGASSGLAAYGGEGEGNVAVIGEVPVAGSTSVAGQVPLSGVVNFAGKVPAAGSVSISGGSSCACVC